MSAASPAFVSRQTDAVTPGSRVPICYGITGERKFYSMEEQFGRPVVLILAGSDALPALSTIVDRFAGNSDAFTMRGADVLLMINDNPSWLWPNGHCPLPTIDCGDFLHRCCIGTSESLVVVADRNMRIAARFPVEEQADPVATCLACLDELPREAARDVVQPAPAIVLPNLVSRDFCESLIALFETSATIDGTVSRTNEHGITQNVIDHGKKRRRDMSIAPETPLFQILANLLLSRCGPEIAKAFQVNVTHIDRILISRYDDSGGWFRRHRDNAAANVAFREFAISVNLNTEAYEGGHLLFPEYNDHCYRPPTGGGLIFSAGILHEAAPVTSGQRYVLLTFFYSNSAESRRKAYLDRAGLAHDRAEQAVQAPLVIG